MRTRVLLTLGVLALLAAVLVMVSTVLATCAGTVCDGFDRADAPSLGTAETGQTWVDSDAAWRIVSGTARINRAGTFITHLSAGVSDGRITAHQTLPNSNNYGMQGLVWRYVDDQNYWYFHTDTSYVRIVKRVNGTETQKYFCQFNEPTPTSTPTGTPASPTDPTSGVCTQPGADFVAILDLEGARQTLTINGGVIVTLRMDSDLVTGTGYGLYGTNTTSYLDKGWDYWGIGPLPTATPTATSTPTMTLTPTTTPTPTVTPTPTNTPVTTTVKVTVKDSSGAVYSYQA